MARQSAEIAAHTSIMMFGAALVQSIAIKFVAEGLATRALPEGAEDTPGFEVLRYHKPRRWLGPPAFQFQLEVLAESDDVPDSVTALVKNSAQEAVVVRTYQTPHQAASESSHFMPLLVCSLPEEALASPARPILSQADLDLVNRTHEEDDTIRPGILKDSRIRAFFIEQAGKAIASGSVVIGHEKIAYIADMVTLPRFRERGYGRQILSALMSEAQRAGCDQAILLPSPFAVKRKFYERSGFRPAGGLRVNYLMPRALSSILVVDRPST